MRFSIKMKKIKIVFSTLWYFGEKFSCYYTLWLCVERFIAIRKPFLVRKWFTFRNSVIILVTIALLCFLLNIDVPVTFISTASTTGLLRPPWLAIINTKSSELIIKKSRKRKSGKNKFKKIRINQVDNHGENTQVNQDSEKNLYLPLCMKM